MSPSSPSADSDRLSHIARHIPGVIYEFVQYPDGRMAFPYASAGLFNLCGISPNAVLEDVSPFFAAVHPDDRVDLAQSIQASAVQLTPWCSEYRFYHPDGRLLWLQSHATPQREPEGLTRWYGCIQDITQQKANQPALEATEHKLRRVIDTINGLVFMVASDGTLSFLSPMVTAVTGHSLDDLLHRPFADLPHPDDLAHVVEQVRACLHGESCRNLEFRALHQDGHYYWYSANLSPFVAEAGAAIACLGIATYIDDRKRTALALQESTARYQSLGANVPGMVYRYLPNGEGGAFTYVSAGCRELFGIEPDQVRQDANLLWALIHPDDLPSLQASVVIAVEQGADWNWEGRFTTATGQPRWLQGRSRLQLTSEGLVWDGLLIDITALKQAEAALSQEVGYRRALFEASGDGIVVLDSTGRVVEANHSFAAMLGYSLQETIGLHVTDFDLAPDLAKVQPETGELWPARFERRHQRQDGSTYAVEICASAVQWNGQSVHLCVCRDIEERQQTERALQESEARFQQLAAASPAVIYSVVESETGIVRFDYISPAVEEIDEISVASAMQNGALISEQIHPEDKERYLATYKASLEAMTTFSCEWRIITSSGKTKWLQASSRPERRPNGEVVWHGIVLETTAQKQAELEIANLQTALLEAQEIAHIGNWSFNLADQTIIWSPELFRMFGMDPALQAPNYDVYLQMIHPDDRPLLVQAVDRAVSQGTPYKIDYRALLPDGSIRYHEGRGRVDRDGAGQVTRLVGTCLDITTRKQSELALQASQLRLELALDSSGTGTWDWNMQTNEIVFSQTPWEKTAGYSADETVDNTIAEWASRIHPEDQAQLDADIAKHMQGETEIYKNEHRLRRQDGTYAWNLAQGKVVDWDEAGQPLRFIGLYQDITDRKRAEHIVRQQAARETLLREISQRIRQSLDLSTTFNTACQEIRACFYADRVGVFKFDADSGYDDGEFVAEAIADGLPSVLATKVHDHCFGANYANLYAQGHHFVISDIYSGDLTTCHTDILAQFQVRASLVLPLLCGDNLWGLLCIHQCREPRQWLQSDIDLGQQLASQLAIALQQALLYQQLQSELQVRQRAEAQIAQQLYQQTALGVILRQIRESLDLEEILSIVTRQVQAIFQCDRAIVFRVFGDGRSQIVEEVVKKPFPALKAMQWEDEVWSQEILDLYWQGQPRIVPDVMADIWTDCLVEYSETGQIKSKVVAPILQEVRTATGDRWLAPGSHHQLWGVLVMHACQTQRVWQDTEAQLLQQIANQLAIAIQQVTIFNQLQQELGDRQCAQQQLSDRNRELAIANQDLSRATRLKDEFLANMSHELRTPLNVILGFAQILNADPSLQAQQREYIRIMQRSGDHLLHLINDILDLSKIEANRITLEPESIDLLSLLYDLQAMFQERAEDKDLAFTLALAPDLPQYIVADPNKLRQVLINLLGNAVKFTQVGGITLRVDRLSGPTPDPEPDLKLDPDSEVTPPQAHLTFTVADTGTGIAPKELTTIFDAFIQAKAGKASLEGTGLGLAISRSLVHLMAGDLTVDSKLGQGSRFRFTLPLRLAEAADVAVVDNLDSVIGLAPGQPTYRILVVDDQPENRRFLVAALSQLGLAVEEAPNGADAIARWRQWHPHLIWMDLRMPGIDGYEATRRIRAEAQERGDGFGPVIIALTAQASREQRDQALAAGCEDFVSKPVQLNLLLTKMADHLGLRYCYADQGAPALPPKPSSGRLNASTLQVMPPAWVSALHRASVLCDSAEAAQLIQQIPPEHGALTAGLTQLLRDYKFEVLMQLTTAHDLR